jgi:lipopolysaccharide/colanic/teichoic acid biosynthesis glycosyltransferase
VVEPTAIDPVRVRPAAPAGLGRVGGGAFDLQCKRAFDLVVAVALIVLLLPLFVAVAAAIALDSPGPVFYRCRRVGEGGRTFDMLKFRKMRNGARGLPLTVAGDARFTRIGGFLSASKLDELPQLWNVVRGEMSLVGPRPEDPSIVALRRQEFDPVLQVTPGITGLCQLEYADESKLLDADDRMAQYLEELLPKKLAIDAVYAAGRTFALDLAIIAWTIAAVALRREVAVDTELGTIGFRHPAVALEPATGEIVS